MNFCSTRTRADRDWPLASSGSINYSLIDPEELFERGVAPLSFLRQSARHSANESNIMIRVADETAFFKPIRIDWG